ncbi:amino acid/amide ABC transporter membrane protein 2, HAAT family (TC 3.A.1.4.-) [Alkalithermobacter thermoalcaliphilus JW-YL-7 = DSM 7308]|uniref:ABC-type transporter, integral membrane subunit n=1 Tax=Alkalithermobacter thermoalcaliphilus JW-YL-7 = DSM 7308 TaxID=1121328 RepID=A0A150FNH3_CLOPD|nr:ABC-type transporter, integral membrane subunit [[Clostridium] paradoxum JW-YL-7 = DSM 7308]SHK91547.1 amino acid/amide ABC transporter membrane protein 2, HAAT family (TC 3.A.1.4.-) [[Clostridium] paradoxum JW-YL-7 = DSM 7308]
MNWFYIQGILILSGINLLAVLGLSLLTGFTGLFSFGHAGFMAIGGYVAAIMTLNFKTPFIISLLLGGFVASLVSLIIGKLTLNLKGDYFCIATLGFGEAIRLILDNIQYFGGARGLAGIPMKTNLTNVLIINIVGVIILANIIRSRHGRNMKAIREEEMASEIIGINVFKYKLISLAISAAYAGIAGGMLAHYLGFLQPRMFQLIKSTELTIIVIFGGLGSISGSIIGALTLTALPEILRTFSQWRLVVYGIAVIFIMISRPQGLMGGYEITIDNIKRFFKKVFSLNKKTETGAD